MSIFDNAHYTAWGNAFLQGIPYARDAGMRVVSIGEGRARVSMDARAEWVGDAARGQLHPGCATVLADTACGVAVGTALNPIVPFATLDLRMDYLRPAQTGAVLECEAHCHRLSRSVAFVRGEVFQQGSEEAVAAVNATFMLGTANARRTDLPAKDAGAPPLPPAATQPAPASPLLARLGELSATPALPAGLSPYVDFLAVERHTLPEPTASDEMLFKLPFNPGLIGNPVLPALHGGVIAGFAETAAVLHLVYSNGLQRDTTPRGVDFAIDYLRSAKPIDTWARCTTVRQGSRVALVQVHVWQDDPTRPIVSARSHCLLPRASE
ncbi:MAG TPA: hotdog domain-containing protein [Aquabacterium sp.]|uniref:PaaI family thioesterase n=1 Tax=Aquabacterium sp. TaxID=1872578 RepID=UPI002DAE723F|nr:hotdog domain-containing protein [Aquabacterium sp.]HET6789239.1 hotdog domain-containing protein [Aquabacterium sp.]HEX5373207.1 hotdog domain-containing protein [Aquabacterium sp.]